nr:hypothetical protein GCM10025732_36380 [Glycomyces mayteni]
MTHLKTDIAVVGGGLGGVAAALAALRRGRRVVLSEEYPWLGGQLTSQAVPPDEHVWVEQFGVTATYRALREGIRAYYRDAYPLTDEARRDPQLNPGRGRVSRLCHEPRAALAVITKMLAPHLSSGRLTVLQPHVPVAAETVDGIVRSVTLRDKDTRHDTVVEAAFVLDATETGDLLPLTGTAYVTGAEGRDETGEPSAPATAQPENMQSIAWCFVFDHVEGDHTIERPADYDHWRSLAPAFWGDAMLSFTAPSPRTLEPETRTFHVNPPYDTVGGKEAHGDDPGDLDLWVFRRIAARETFLPGSLDSDIVLANWPQLDYLGGNVIDTPDRDVHLRAAKAQSRAFVYWLQTEAPGPTGVPGGPGCACAATSSAPATASRRRRTSASPGASARCAPSSSRTWRSPSAATAAPPASRTPWASACTASTCTPPPAATTTSTSSAPLRDPARGPRPGPDPQPPARRQEHRHHAHHQRRLPAPPRRVERRRIRRRARRVLPRPLPASRGRPRETRTGPPVPGRPHRGRRRNPLARDHRLLKGTHHAHDSKEAGQRPRIGNTRDHGRLRRRH